MSMCLFFFQGAAAWQYMCVCKALVRGSVWAGQYQRGLFTVMYHMSQPVPGCRWLPKAIGGWGAMWGSVGLKAVGSLAFGGGGEPPGGSDA